MSRRPNRIRELREELGLTQDQLAKLIDLDDSLISRVETGDREPTAEQIRELVKVFKLEAIRDLFVAPEPVA